MFDMMLLSIESASRVSVEAILNGLWQGIALTAALWALLKMIPRLTPSARHVIWSATLAVVVALPFVSGQQGLQSALRNAHELVFSDQAQTNSIAGAVTTKGSDLSSKTEATENSNTANLKTLSASGNERFSVATKNADNPEYLSVGITPTVTSSQLPISQPENARQLATGIQGEATIAGSMANEVTAPAISLTLTSAIALSLFAIWLVVSLLLLIRVLKSYLYLRRLRKSGRALPPWLRERFESLAGACGVKRKVAFLSSDKIRMPLAIGLFKPAIIFPRALESALSATELDQIALHELAHLTRYDDRSVLLQRLALALFFFHPAALWISRRLDSERELACDDVVVRFTGIRTDYAACLTHLAELTLTPRQVSMAAGAFLTKKRLVRRVERILADKLSLGAAASRAIVTGALLLLVAALAQFIFTPAVVAVGYPNYNDEPSESELTKRSGDIRVEPAPNSVVVPAVYVGPEITGSEILYVPSVSSDAVITLPNAPVLIANLTGNGQAALEKTYLRLLKSLSQQRKLASGRGAEEFSRSASRLRELETRYQEIYEDATQKTNSRKLARARRRLERAMNKLNRTSNSIKGNTGIAFSAPQTYVIAPNVSTSPSIVYAPSKTGYADSYSFDTDIAPTVPSLSYNFSGFSGSGVAFESQRAPRPPHIPRLPRVPSVNSLGGSDSWSFSSGNTTITGDFVINSDDGEVTYSWSERGHRIQMRARGKIEFSKDDADVVGLSDDGYLIIRERHRGDDREYEVADDGQGGLDKVYYQDGRRTEIDDDARKWIGEMVLRAIRNTGIGAEDRVERIMKSGGVDAVLDEIEEIHSGYAMRIYYRVLMDQSELNVSQRIQLLKHLSHELDSDYERAEILSGIDDSWLEDKRTRMAYVDAVGQIDSDYEKRRALGPIISRKDLSADLRLTLLEIARVIDSDYERAELLGEIARSGLDESEVIEAYMLALEDIDSDFEKRRVLTFITDRRDMSKETALAVLKMARSIDSDYERAELLLDMYRYSKDDDGLLRAYVDAIEDIDSDYEKRRVLDELTSRGTLTEDLALTVLRIATTIDSDYERAELLSHMARFCTGHDKLIAAYVDALSDLGSDYETRRVLERLDIDEETDPALIDRILRVVERMDSDYEKTQILEDLAPFCLDDDELYGSFLDAVDSISSEYERNKLLSIIYDHDRHKRKSKKK